LSREDLNKKEKKIDLENLFAEIQTQLKVNNRRAYVPPQGLSPGDLEQALEQLTESQKAFATAIRENRYRFITKRDEKLSDAKLAEFKESFNHFDKNKSNTLDKLEFKAALSAMSVFFNSDSDFENVFLLVSQGQGHVTSEQYINYLTTKYTSKDSPDQVKDAFRAVADGGQSITRQQLGTPPLSNEDAEFLAKVLPANADGSYDYASYIDSAFAME